MNRLLPVLLRNLNTSPLLPEPCSGVEFYDAEMTLSNTTMFPTPRTVAESRTTLDHTVGAPHPPTIYQLLSITKLRFIILITFFNA